MTSSRQLVPLRKQGHHNITQQYRNDLGLTFRDMVSIGDLVLAKDREMGWACATEAGAVLTKPALPQHHHRW